MILVTGGTGFVGQALIRQLVAQGKAVRTLLRPSQSSPNLPRGIPVEVAVSSLNDERSLLAALKGVDTIFHLAGSERIGSKADLTGVDIAGTRTLVQTAVQAKVKRIFYLSHLGADRASAFALLKAKAIAEHFIIKSGVNYTIFRSGPIYGPGDQFTTALAKLLRMSPGFFLMPGDGNTLLQPIWIEDLITCLLLSLDDPQTLNQTFSIGGAEYYSFREIVEILLQKLSLKRFLVSIQPPYLRLIGLFMEQFMPRFPVSIFWLDYLAVDRTCALDILPRLFGLMPVRFSQNLDYLSTQENATGLKL